ncbi:MAG TPA: diguanylate cyclase, partial [Lachnospiraceae bacterium]|nr:diguanylate cyclase [Lachnospiraceae bacterium]
MKKKIKKVFGINIEQEIRADFDKEIIRANNVRCKIVLIILCVPMIPYVIHLFLTSDPELPANCLILFIELIGLYLLFFHENAEYIGTLHILIMVVCLAWSQYVNYMNDQSAVNYMPYLIGLMGLAAVAYLRPLQSVVLFGLNHLVFLLISFHVIKDGTILLENSVNSTIAVLFSILFSISNYHSKLRHSVNKKLLTDLHEANAKLTEYVHKDVGTGINNRRALNERLDTEWENALIFQKPLSFMMIDIDFFKQYNDTYGHSRGDVCLREVAQCISDITKKFNAYVARFGGEEFSVLLPDMNEE